MVFQKTLECPKRQEGEKCGGMVKKRGKEEKGDGEGKKERRKQ